jgi:hypothetical protein
VQQAKREQQPSGFGQLGDGADGVDRIGPAFDAQRRR